MSALVRRSVLLVCLQNGDAVANSWRHDADAIVLELPQDIAASRSLLPKALNTAGRGGAEVFVRIDNQRTYAEIKVAVQPGLTGIMLSNPDSSVEIDEVDDILREREREEGVPIGQVEILLCLGSPRSIWNVRELINASPRIASVAIDERSLCWSMGITATAEFDPLTFSRGRVIVETLAAAKLPLGIGHPLGALPCEPEADALVRLADRARNTGFKGALCYFPSWVAACNTAFTPSEAQVAYYREVRAAFASGLARGTAAVPFPGGRMIDVPVDERAKLGIEWWERCQRRDAEKAAARAANSSTSS
jgi:citrate lyase subunit beta/citryl-CoA lyase